MLKKWAVNGCAYDKLNKKEIEKLIEDFTKVRPEMLNKEGLELFNTIMKILDERETLIQERDFYKTRYNEFSEFFLKMGKR